MGSISQPYIEDVDISTILNSYAHYPFFFTLKDINNNFVNRIDDSHLLDIIKNNPQFIVIEPPESHFIQIISENSLFNWYANINLKSLNIDGLISISRKQLFNKLTSIVFDCNCHDIPEKIIKYGEKYGFITIAEESNLFLPLVFVLRPFYEFRYYYSGKNKTEYPWIIRDFLNDLGELPAIQREIIVERTQEEWFQIFFDSRGFKEEVKAKYLDISLKREGLSSNRKHTLQELSEVYGLTRERIRQIENKIWFSHQKIQTRKIILEMLITLTMNNFGSVIFNDLQYIVSLLDHIGYKFSTIPKTDLLISKINNIDFLKLDELLNNQHDFFERRKIYDFLRANFPFCSADIELITEQIYKLKKGTFKISDRVVICLRAIGKPAHFSEVHSQLCEMYPDITISEHNVHAILSRLSGSGMVAWIGVKGTYALTEWGYDVPEKGLFDTVTEIVKTHYAETGRPISINKIKIEIGKYRRIINKNSLQMAIILNDQIFCISKNYYAPIATVEIKNEQVEDKKTEEEIHKGFEIFKQNISNKTN